MGYRAISAILILFLVGCSSPVLIPQVQAIKLPPDPVNGVAALTDKSSPDEVVRAWVATATAYRNWNRTVRKQIETINNENLHNKMG